MKNIKVFSNLKEETYEKLDKILVSKNIKKKQILFYEREIVDKVYFLSRGKVSLFKISEGGERKVIFILKEGEMINGVLADEPKTSAVSCEVFEDSQILECSSNDLLSIMEDDFQLTKNILFNSQNINRRLCRQLKNSISIRMDKKLAAKLYRMGREFGIYKDGWTLINANLTTVYLADMLGCKRETLSRAMKVLQDENLVKFENRKVYIKQDELANYFKI